MENRTTSTKRKYSEGSLSGSELVKKFRVEVVIPKHPVPEKLLERLRKLSSKKKNTTNHDHKENNSTPSCKTIQKSPLQAEPEALSPTLGESLLCCGEEATSSVQGLLPPPACKSPVEHRLSNLLNGELNSTESYENTDLHVCYGDNVQSIDEYRKSNFTEQVSHLESLRLPLRSTDRQSSEIDTIFPFAQNEDHQLVTGRCLQTVGNAVESSSPTDCSKMYGYLATSLEGKNSGNKLIDERKVLEGDVISKVQKCVTANSHKGKENGLANANCSADNGRTPDTIAKVESVSSSGCLPISDSSQGNSVDFSTNFNTLEFMNSLLSELTQERTMRTEVEERMNSIKIENEKLVMECEKLKDLLFRPEAKPKTISRGTQVNMTLVSTVECDMAKSKTVSRGTQISVTLAKSKTISRGTQINMAISLRRGRTVDKAVSPMRQTNPPDVMLLSPSVRCQTSPCEPPKRLVTSFCQTEEEVIPPKILMSAATQTMLTIPSEIQQQLGTTYQSAVPSSRLQSMVIGSGGLVPPTQLSFRTWHVPTSNSLQTAYRHAVESYQLSVGVSPQHEHPFVMTQQRELSGITNRVNSASAVQHHPATMASIGSVPSVAYLTGALSSTQPRPMQSNVVQYLQMPGVMSYQTPSTLARQTSNNQFSAPSTGSPHPLSQGSIIPQSPIISQVFSQNPVHIARVYSLSGRQQYGTRPMETSSGHESSAAQQLTVRGILQSESQINSSSCQMPHQQNLNSSNTQPQIHGVTQVRSLLCSPTLQPTTHVSSSGNPGEGRRNSVPTQFAPSLSTAEPIPANTTRLSHYQGATSTLTLNQSPSTSAEQLHPRPRSLNVQMNSQGTPLSVNQQQQSLHSLLTQSTTVRSALQQASSHTLGGQSQFDKQRNSTSLSRNLNDLNLNSTSCQSSGTHLAVQPSVLSSSTLTRTPSSNRYRNVKDVRQSGTEKNLYSSKERATAQVGPLYEQVKLVCNELQQSLDEVTEKQRERIAIVTTNKGSCTQTNTIFLTSSSSSGLSQEKPGSKEERMIGPADSSKHRTSLKKPNGALEEAVQRLLALQKTGSSPPTGSRDLISESVNEPFDGVSQREKFTTPATSAGGTVSHPEHVSENEPVSYPVSVTEAAETCSLHDEDNTSKEVGRSDCLAANIKDSDTEAIGCSITVNGGDSVLVSPSPPLTTPQDSDNQNNPNKDVPNGYYLSPTILQVYSSRRVRSQTSHSRRSSGDDDDSDSSVTELTESTTDQYGGENTNPADALKPQGDTPPTLRSSDKEQSSVVRHHEEGTRSAEPRRRIADEPLITTDGTNVAVVATKSPEFSACETETCEPFRKGDNADVEVEIHSESEPPSAKKKPVTNVDRVNLEDVADVSSPAKHQESVQRNEDLETSVDCMRDPDEDDVNSEGLHIGSGGAPDFQFRKESKESENVENGVECCKGTEDAKLPETILEKVVNEGGLRCERGGEAVKERGAETQNLQQNGKEIDSLNNGLFSPIIAKQDGFRSMTKRITTSDIEGIVKQLERKDVNENQIADGLLPPDKRVDRNEKENAPYNQEQHDSYDIPKQSVPRVFARVVNSELVVCWDLPPDNQLANIEHFELFCLNLGGEWLPIAQIKALKLPMGCRLKSLQPGNTYSFRVRVIGRDGVIGVFSEPSKAISL